MPVIELLKADITKLDVDAVVNAANPALMGGGGVDGAIHMAAGPSLIKECKAIIEKSGPCETGEAVITSAGNMPAKYIIHTVGPVWHGLRKQEGELLRASYLNSLQLAVENGCVSVAFPNISTGVYGFPKRDAAEFAISAVEEFLFELDEDIQMKVIFCCFDEENFSIYQQLLGV